MSCPSCHAELTLDVLMQHEAARRAVARLAQVSLPFGALTLQYMALFKPASRALSIDRMVRLIEELLPDIERRAITREGRDWDADTESWRSALTVVLGMRDKGRLRLPLTDHGLLYQVLLNQADKVEARAERDRESHARGRTAAGPRQGMPRDLSTVLPPGAAVPLASDEFPVVVKTGTPAPAYAAGPSRAALALRAQIEAAQRQRAGGLVPPATDGEPDA